MKSVRLTVRASAANLGPGFDSIGPAVTAVFDKAGVPAKPLILSISRNGARVS